MATLITRRMRRAPPTMFWPPLSGTLGSKQRPRWLNLSCPLEVTPRCPEAVPPASSNQSCRSG